MSADADEVLSLLPKRRRAEKRGARLGDLRSELIVRFPGDFLETKATVELTATTPREQRRAVTSGVTSSSKGEQRAEPSLERTNRAGV
jgi:hypothetical protein